MARRSCDGAGFLAAFRSAVASLEANVDEINALNVFPVPDGDTGTNMLATVRAALEEADKVGPDADVERVAQAVSFGALMGARGNSGVITSQILAGMAHGLAGQAPVQRPRPRARARRGHEDRLQGRRQAGRGHDPHGHPRGVRRRRRRRRARQRRRGGARGDASMPPSAPSRRRRRCCRSCARRTSSTPAARACSACSRARSRRPAAARSSAGDATATAEPRRETSHAADPVPGAEEGEFGYETVYLLRARAGVPLDIPAIQAHLEGIGDSVLVAGDGLLAKVHVHNERPDAVIAYGLTIGTLSRITIENLDSQAHDVRETKAAAFVAGAGAGVASSADGDGAAAEVPADAASRWASSWSPRRRASRRS